MIRYRSKEIAVFNPGVESHRKAYSDFAKTKSWALCKYKFTEPEGSLANLLGSIQISLLEYYSLKEFSDPEPDYDDIMTSNEITILAQK